MILETHGVSLAYCHCTIAFFKKIYIILSNVKYEVISTVDLNDFFVTSVKE